MFSKIFRRSLTLSCPSLKHNFSVATNKQELRGDLEDTNDATSQLFRSIQSTIKGITHINQIVEHDPNLSEEEKLRKKRFLVYKYNPADDNDTPKLVSYYIDLTQISPMYLDALIYIKDNLDSTLAFRRSCREGICGSCSMNCDGLQTLACIKPINRDLTKAAILSPLGHMFVLKDLVVDMTNFYIQHKTVDPYLRRKTPKAKGEENKELYQSPEDRKLLDGLYECILCACCSTSCPSYWWRPDRYLGPAALLQAYRWIQDSRDEYKDERLEVLAKGDRLTDCVNIGMCTFTCPKNLDPRSAINDLFVMVKKLKEKEAAQEHF